MGCNDSKPLPPLSEKDITRFRKYVDKTPGQGPKGECWEWVGNRDYSGYGRFRVGLKILKASRVAFFLESERDPFPLDVCHSCDWPPCCKYEHFFTGNQTENNRDMTNKGRRKPCFGDTNGARTHPETRARGEKNGARLHPERLARGEKCGSAKLTRDSVREIRSLARVRTMADMATRFGVHRNTINNVINGHTWTHM